jgi:puromycin-sensitive aminopeptidase
VRAEAGRRFDSAAGGQAELDPDLTAAILGAVAASGDERRFDEFLERYRRPATPQEEMRYLYALAGFPDASLALRAFELARTQVRTQNAPFLIHSLLSSRDTGPAVWDQVRAHWDDLGARMPANILPRMLDGVKLLCRDASGATEISTFITSHPLPIGAKTVEQILERLAVNVAFASALSDGAGPVLDGGVDRVAP